MIKINVLGSVPIRFPVKENTTLEMMMQALPKTSMQILIGYPQRAIFGKPDELLANLGIKSGDTVHACEGEPSMFVEVMKRFVIDADNSCLFRAIGFCLGYDSGELRSPADVDCAKFRNMVAEAVLIQTDNVLCTEAMLGKIPQDYASWILHPDHWGGEIELSLLALATNTNIQIVDIESQTTLCYNSSAEEIDKPKSNRKIFLLFDGIHYDCLVRGKAGCLDVSATLFDVDDHEAPNQALAIASACKSNSMFTNVASKTGGFQLKCLVCREGCVDADAARMHATKTGHQNFGQYA
jgi:ubiquitin thioesterase OTU1